MNPPAPQPHEHFAGDRAAAIVFRLAEDIRLAAVYQMFRGRFIEQHDGIHIPEVGHQLCPMAGGMQRTERSFESPDAGIAIDSHNQPVSLFCRVTEGRQVSRMQQIETAVGEDDPIACRMPGGTSPGELGWRTDPRIECLHRMALVFQSGFVDNDNDYHFSNGHFSDFQASLLKNFERPLQAQPHSWQCVPVKEGHSWQMASRASISS